MANWLRMAQIHAIEGLWRQGWSRRRIARELGLDRATVRKYIDGLLLQAQNQPNLTSGKSADLGPNTGLSAESENPIPATNLTAGSPGPASKSEVFRDVIVAKQELGLSAQRIYQDLRAEKRFPGSYESVKRFVRKLEAAIPLPFRRMECGPGEECQVDSGKGAWGRREHGKRKRPWLFRIILSHSRKGYSDSRRSGAFLFEIIMRRHQTRSTIMTSNRPIEEWAKLIGDVPSAMAILDRFLQTAEVIEIMGKSYRLKDRVLREGG